MAEECKDGCAKVGHLCREVEGHKRTLFGENGLGGISKEMGRRATWGLFWVIFAFLCAGIGGSHLYQASSIAECADKEEIKEIQKSVKEANASIHRQELSVSRIEGAISPLVDVIADEKKRSTEEDKAIRKIQHDDKDEMNRKLNRLERKVDALRPGP